MLSSKANLVIDTLVQRLVANGTTLSTAESCTGGLLGAAITERAGTSAIYIGGVSAYSNALKETLLHVPKQTMIDHGTVSEPVALAMAQSIQRIAKSDYAIAITGVAGPGGGTETKPVGMVCLAIAGPDNHAETWTIQANGGRADVRDQAVQVAADKLISWLPDAP